MPIGQNDLMANDVPEIMGRTNENENRSKIFIDAESRDEADKLYNVISAEQQIEGQIEDSPWSSNFDCFRANYGIELILDFGSKA